MNRFILAALATLLFGSSVGEGKEFPLPPHPLQESQKELLNTAPISDEDNLGDIPPATPAASQPGTQDSEMSKFNDFIGEWSFENENEDGSFKAIIRFEWVSPGFMLRFEGNTFADGKMQTADVVYYYREDGKVKWFGIGKGGGWASGGIRFGEEGGLKLLGSGEHPSKGVMTVDFAYSVNGDELTGSGVFTNEADGEIVFPELTLTKVDE